MQVMKRNGQKEDFNKDKIFNAISLANDNTRYKYKLTKTKIREITDNVAELYEEGNKVRSVEFIQDMIEEALVEAGAYGVAKAYITYRYKSDIARGFGNTFINEITKKLSANDVQNQNANVDEHSFGGRMGEATSVLTKKMALENLVSKTARANHEDNMIYIHDLDQYFVGSHNCLSIPFDKLLAEGFNTRQSDIRPAGSVNTAFQLLAVIFQLQSLQQFGGVSATHLDWTMIPYVRKSFYKHYKDAMIYLAEENDGEGLYLKEEYFLDNFLYFIKNQPSIDDEYFKKYKHFYKYAMDMTIKEVHQAVEGMYHNLNTLQSRSGNQLPFTSINYGTCTLPEGRMITKALLEVSIEGLGRLHKTSIFPCGIFQYMRGVNDKPGTPNYDLYRLALKSTSKRLYPNYANCDWSNNISGDDYDFEIRQNYINSLSDADYNKLIEKLETNPELQNILGLALEEGERYDEN